LSKPDIEARIEAAKLRKLERKEKTETLRFYLPIVVPLLSAVAVFGALVFQAIQFKKSIEIQRETINVQKDTAAIQRSMTEEQKRTAEDAAWREAVKTFNMANPNLVSSHSNNAILKGFLKAGDHKEDARNLAVEILALTIDQDLFADLFHAVFDTSSAPAEANDETWNTIQKTTEINRRLKTRFFEYNDVSNSMFGKTGPRPQWSIRTIETNRGLLKLNPENVKYQLGIEIDMVSNLLATYLRLPRSEARERVDLADSALSDCDVSGVNLRGAVLDYVYIYNVKLEDADLSEITKFTKSNWDNTAWWHAKSVGSELLNYLKTSYPYSKKTYNGSITTSEDDYNQNISRLEGLRNNS